MNKIGKIDQQLLRLEEQRKALLQKKKKEQDSKLREIGESVAKVFGGVENVDMDPLKEMLARHYLDSKSPSQKGGEV